MAGTELAQDSHGSKQEPAKLDHGRIDDGQSSTRLAANADQGNLLRRILDGDNKSSRTDILLSLAQMDQLRQPKANLKANLVEPKYPADMEIEGMRCSPTLTPENNDAAQRPADQQTPRTDARDSLVKFADQITTPYVHEHVKDWVSQIEDRVHRGEISGAVADRTYASVLQLATSSNGEIAADQRMIVASDILMHAANPAAIYQGEHDTCTVNVLENKVFTERPDIAAGMIVSAALTGKWTAADGKVIEIDKGTLEAADSAEKTLPTPDGARTQASQIFQAVALNDVAQRSGSTFIHEKDSSWWLPRFFEDPRKKLGDYWVTGDDRKVPFTGLTMGETVAEGQRLLGNENILLANVADPRVKECVGAPVFHDKEEFEAQLATAKDKHQLPMALPIWGNDLQLYHYLGSWAPSLESGPHAVVARDYDPKTHKVFINNSWGEGYNEWIKVEDLWPLLVRGHSSVI